MWYYTIGQGAKVYGMSTKMFVATKGVGKDGNDILVVPGSYVLLPDALSLVPHPATNDTCHADEQ